MTPDERVEMRDGFTRLQAEIKDRSDKCDLYNEETRKKVHELTSYVTATSLTLAVTATKLDAHVDIHCKSRQAWPAWVGNVLAVCALAMTACTIVIMLLKK